MFGMTVEAIHHSSIVIGGREYYYGNGIQVALPGMTPHGSPMRVLPLGLTQKSEDEVAQHVAELSKSYTPQNYDLIHHNCNNFADELARLLVGHGIPEYIISTPRTLLATPLGQALRPHLDQMMKSVNGQPLQHGARQLGPSESTRTGRAEESVHPPKPSGKVRIVSSARDLDPLLIKAAKTGAVIFFTSSTCPPCKVLYPAYDELAAEAGHALTLIKVDINKAFDVGQRYAIRATPTFMTFLKGRKENTWMGANESQLRGNVRLLMQMAQHPHALLDLPILARVRLEPVTYTKIPPLDKLVTRLGKAGHHPGVISVQGFVKARYVDGEKNVPLPDLGSFSQYLQQPMDAMDIDNLFAVVDLLRIALMDARVGQYFAQEVEHASLRAIVRFIHGPPQASIPYPLHLVTIQASCNLFMTPSFPPQILTESYLTDAMVKLSTEGLLDAQHPAIRVAATSLAFNLAIFNYQRRVEDDGDLLLEGPQVELLASLLETLDRATVSAEASHGILLAIAFLIFRAPENETIWELVQALDARGTINRTVKKFPDETLAKEISTVLLGRGFGSQ
ncbi:MAG: hypothetical protein M1838_000808 [Thelocarpon superellum]|nr:MAG: hypothetical protein M1838_000808 [Thelocarpon superellum]